jgi:large subunit ribosomal protein L15
VANNDKIGLHNLAPARGSHRDRKRLGRGPGFEGGQMPLTRRIPKRGFTNPFRREPQVVRLGDLEQIAGDVTLQSLAEAGLVKPKKGPVKVLANGRVTRAVTVRGIKLSAGAREKIVAAGGRVEE